MGTPKRARSIVERMNPTRFGLPGWVEDAIFNAFDKCGNCPHRIKCYTRLLGKRQDKIVASYKHFYDCEGECSKPVVEAGGVARLAAEQVRYCVLSCDKTDICIAHVLRTALPMLGPLTSPDRLEHIVRLRRCCACPQFESCLELVLVGLRRNRITQLLLPVGRMWRDCKCYRGGGP